jgi:hypothetical protein
MRIRELGLNEAVVSLSPTDCALLAELCNEAGILFTREDQKGMLATAEAYGSALSALAVAVPSTGFIDREVSGYWKEEMAAMGLTELVRNTEPMRMHGAPKP